MAQTKVKEGLIDATLGGGITWDSTAKTANFPAAAGSGYLVDTSSSAITVTLPSSPSVGDEVTLVDYGANAATNNITITSSDDIEDSTDDVKIDYNKGSVVLFYSGATKGWLVKSAANETATALAIDLPPLTVDYLVVAGGGGGGSGFVNTTDGGGGGAGGLRTSYTLPTGNSGGGASAESTLTLATATNYTVTVGPGGSSNNPGYDSVFSDLTSNGGGEGAGGSNASDNAGDGGSGGGTANGASSTQGSGTPDQGFDGGSAVKGGGGGAAAAGNSNTNDGNGNGGAGLAVNILNSTNAAIESVGEVSGSDVYYSGGGAAGGLTDSAGGIGGGGNGFDGGSTISGENGAPNTGGGGAGTNDDGGASGGTGGSGVVILRYPSGYTITETTSGGNVLTFNTYTEGSDNVTVFTAGDGTIQFST